MKRVTDFRFQKSSLFRHWYVTAIEFFIITKVAERYLALLHTFQFNNALSLKLILKTGILLKCSDADIADTLAYKKTSVFKDIRKGGHDIIDIIELWNKMNCNPKLVVTDTKVFKARTGKNKIEIGRLGWTALKKANEARFFSKYKGGENVFHLDTVETMEFIFMKIRKRLRRDLKIREDKLDTLQTGFRDWRIGNKEIDKILHQYRKLATKKEL
jgi:hypothetical protein